MGYARGLEWWQFSDDEAAFLARACPSANLPEPFSAPW
jgi:hypothetical protein